MNIKINRQVFNTLEDTQLVRACFEPLVPLIRGKSQRIKEEVYGQLTPEQKKLFIFNAYYNHASNSLAEFYWWSAYYLSQPKIWSELIQVLHYFNADEMRQILLEMEQIIFNAKNLEVSDVSYNDLEKNPDLSSVNPLFDKFSEVSPATLNLIGKVIRNNQTAYILFDDKLE
ncbi:hypothetical protein [Bacillus xiapuensis]|uniref:Uncharacterized protein n=1 Tax=Bacillus xiapuensis TaxID=2014075 RepID=A0ABU6N9N5_9BACI|nr:hypothetical protein [Bacillus xiapuensis]